jgi:hypothetical protein
MEDDQSDHQEGQAGREAEATHQPPQGISGRMADTIKIVGDVQSPVRRSGEEADGQALPERQAVILLDTHAWLWLGGEPRRLSRVAATAIESAASSGGIAIASVTLVEIAWLMARRCVSGFTAHPRHYSASSWRTLRSSSTPAQC